jgi:hypothetical protein
LTDGKVTCLDLVSPAGAELQHTAIIEPDADGSLFNGFFYFAYWLGEPSKRASRLVEDAGRLQTAVASLQECKLNVDGTATVRFKIGKSVRVYEIDLEKGGIPTTIKDVRDGGELIGVVTYDGLKLIKGAGWMPTRKTVYLFPSGIVRQATVIDHDVTRAVPKSDFALEFREALNIPDKSVKRVLLKVNRLSLHNRAPRSIPFTTPLSPKGVKPIPELPGEIEADRWPGYTYVGFGVVAATAVLVVLKRKAASP